MKPSAVTLREKWTLLGHRGVKTTTLIGAEQASYRFLRGGEGLSMSGSQVEISELGKLLADLRNGLQSCVEAIDAFVENIHKGGAIEGGL